MRVALVAEDFYPQVGGVPEHIHHLALELLRLGHQVTVVTSRMTGEYPANFHHEYPVIRLGTSVVIHANGGVARVTVGWRLQRQLEAVFREHDFDVVHVHGPLVPSFGTLVPGAARSAGIPIVATFHSWYPPSPSLKILREPLQRILDSHAANIAVSKPVADVHAQYFKADWEIIPNGVDLTYFHPNGTDATHDHRNGNGRSSLKAQPDAPRLLFLHRLEPRNHLGTLLAAMPRILARHPNAQLIVAGHGPLASYYRHRARPLGDRVRFLGHIDDRVEQYRAADLYLCPTMRAGFGITLLEAMACGTPAVIADNPGFRSVVNGGREAVHLPHDNPALWAEAVLSLLASPRRLAAMSAAGVTKARQFAWPLVAAQIVDVYVRVTGASLRVRGAEDRAAVMA